MNEPLGKPQDHFTDTDLFSVLNIFVDNEGIMQYNCDWDNTAEGISAVASIFYKIMFDDLPESILAEIKQQCVLNGNEENYMQIISLISSFAVENNKEDLNANDDEVVVQPDQVFHL